MNNRESSHPSIEEIPFTPTENDSLSQSSAMRDSIITYTTDLGSSVESMTRAADSDVGEDVKKPKPSRQSPSRIYHQKRFWAICMATNVVLAAIFIPLFFLVIIPSIAQKAINDSELQILSMNVTNPTDDGFEVDMLGKSLHAGKFDATLTFVGPLSVKYKGEIIGTISSLDTLKITKGEGLVKGSGQKFKIVNFTLFEQYSRDSILGTSFEWSIHGTVNIRSIGITTKNLKLDKTMTVSGAGGFSNASLTNLEVSLNPDQTLRLVMDTKLYNPSPIGMEIGNLSLQVQYNGTTLANLTSDYFILTSGENPLSLTGNGVFPADDAGKLNVIKLIGAYITNRPVSTTSKGLYTVLRDNVSAGWLNATIQGISLQTTVGNLAQPLQLVKGVDFGETSLVFTPDTAYAPIATSKNASSVFKSPFNMPFEIESFQQNLTIYFQDKPIIEFDSPPITTTSNDTGITFDVPSTPMKALDDAHDLFSDFLATLSKQPAAEVQLVGTTSIRAKIPFGVFPLDDIPFNITLNMEGFSLFKPDQALNISDFTIKGFDPKQTVVNFNIIITARKGITIGPVSLQIFSQDQQIGIMAFENLSIVPGTNSVNVQITLLTEFAIKSVASNGTTIVNIRGYDGSTNIDSLKKVFTSLNVSAPLPPLPKTGLSSILAGIAKGAKG